MATHVFSIRVADEIHRMMEDMKDVNWNMDIRKLVEEFVKEKRRERLLEESDSLRSRNRKIGVNAADLIREDRDAR
jgi:hypothetical protein